MYYAYLIPVDMIVIDRTDNKTMEKKKGKTRIRFVRNVLFL